MLGGVWALIAGAIVLFLPGIAWFAWFPEESEEFTSVLAEVIGLSIAFSALTALAFFLFGWTFSVGLLVIIYTLLGLLTIAGFVRRTLMRRVFFARYEWEDAPLLAFFVLLLAWRFYQARDLVLPAWVDSVHHVLIVRVILEQGGLPADLRPYLPVPFYYHFAFHVISAVFSVLTGLEPAQAVLWIGQVLNAAVGFSIYRLGRALWPGWRRAALAAVLVGFVSQMPAYYLTWGRYTLLTGLILLPLGMALALEISRGARTPGRLVRLAILTGGLLLSHYFAAVLFALFLVILGIAALLGDLTLRANWRESRLVPLVVSVLAGAALAAPWVLRTISFSLGEVHLGAVLPSSGAVEEVYFPDYPDYVLRLLGPARDYLFLSLAPLGLVIAGIRKSTRVFALWGLALGVTTLPWGIYVTPFRPDHSAIVLFLPATLLVSDFFISAWDRFSSGRFPRFGPALIVIAIACLVLWGGFDMRSILNPTTLLAGEADLKAVRWVQTHTPPGANFFINVTPWQYSTYRGVDGGWWIMPVAGRNTLLPPVLYDMGNQEYVDRVNAFARTASQVKSCTSQFWDLVHSAGLTYVYLKEGSGSLQPGGLANCPGLSLIYDQDGVYIYQIEDIKTANLSFYSRTALPNLSFPNASRVTNKSKPFLQNQSI